MTPREFGLKRNFNTKLSLLGPRQVNVFSYRLYGRGNDQTGEKYPHKPNQYGDHPAFGGLHYDITIADRQSGHEGEIQGVAEGIFPVYEMPMAPMTSQTNINKRMVRTLHMIRNKWDGKRRKWSIEL
jgi:hypothetical protein